MFGSKKEKSGLPVLTKAHFLTNLNFETKTWKKTKNHTLSKQAILNYENIKIDENNMELSTNSTSQLVINDRWQGDDISNSDISIRRQSPMNHESKVTRLERSLTPDSGITDRTFDSRINESILIQSSQSSRKKKSRISKCLSRIEQGLSIVQLAGCFENVSRLSLQALLHGGVPFILGYLILSIFLGLPLIFLELGIGQIVQQGLTKTWRAVPMFRGVGYVKLLANFLVCVYYPLYIGLALYYIVWILKGPLPFRGCSVTKISRDGYVNKGIPGQECLNKTFLESPSNDAKWFGIYVSFIAATWIIILVCSVSKIKTYIRISNIYFLPVVGILIFLLVATLIEKNEDVTFFQNINWQILLSAEVWYFALVQLFFSTHLGFGNVITCAGKFLNKTDPFWGALAYFISNIVVGLISAIVFYILSGPDHLTQNLDGPNIKFGDRVELLIFTNIYDYAANNAIEKTKVWAGLAYLVIFLSGLISMLVTVFTIVKSIHVESKKRWRWSKIATTFCIILFFLSCLCLFLEKIKIIHIFDYYVVGNLLLIATFLEVTAFVAFYGLSSIYVDFEFILGSKLSPIWKFMWSIAPILIVAISIWAISTLPITRFFYQDESWTYITGWSILGASLIVVLVTGIYEISRQVDYNFLQKLSSALKAKRKWGPTDPILRHGWIQWRTKRGKNDRDFGNHQEFVQKSQNNLVTSRYTSSIDVTNGVEQGPSTANGTPMQVASMADTLELRVTPKVLKSKMDFFEHRAVLNPLGVPAMYGETETEHLDSSGPEIQENSVDFYDSYSRENERYGPYIISNDNVNWRRPSENATHL